MTGSPSTNRSRGPQQPPMMFRRLQYTGHASAFWDNLITSGQGSDGKKTVLQLKRAEIPMEVMATATKAQKTAAGNHAAQRSVMVFMDFVDRLSPVTSPGAGAQRQKILMLEMKHVGIKCEGRSGPYDLMYFPHTDKVYAADSMDDSVVYVLA